MAVHPVVEEVGARRPEGEDAAVDEVDEDVGGGVAPFEDARAPDVGDQRLEGEGEGGEDHREVQEPHRANPPRKSSTSSLTTSASERSPKICFAPKSLESTKYW